MLETSVRVFSPLSSSVTVGVPVTVFGEASSVIAPVLAPLMTATSSRLAIALELIALFTVSAVL